MTHNHNIALSFCIPTYNRASCVVRCIKWILEYSGEDIEIIVSDNGSPDNTGQLLKEISDKRLKYFRNDKNEGVQFNIKRVLDEASGEFCFLLSDEDQINIDKISYIIDIIKNNSKLALIYGGVLSTEKGGNTWTSSHSKVLSLGAEAVKQIAFKHPYFSGIIVNKGMYEIISASSVKWYQQDILYPHEYLTLRLALMGDVFIMKDTIVWTHDYKNETFTGSNKIKSAYSYEGRMTTYKQRIIIILENIDDQQMKTELMLDNFRTMLYCGTVGYYTIAKDHKRSKAMQVETEKLKLRKLINLFYNDSRDFIKEEGIILDDIIYLQMEKIVRDLKRKAIFADLYGTPFYWQIKNMLLLLKGLKHMGNRSIM